jgi:hypothetical protein
LWFGTGYDPARLPEGWQLIESNDDFARAIAPDGKEYYLGLEEAYLLTGSRQIDMLTSIPLRQV